ncbi:hypothetical protein B1A_01088, partial [mine drainage metagenome]
MVFSCNRLPPVPGATPAFWVRILLTIWEVKVGKSEDTPDYAGVLLAEAPGIFRRFFEASKRLMERGEFPDLPVDVADRWLRSSDPAAWVAEHELEDDPDGEVVLDDVLSRVDQVSDEENVEEPPGPRAVAAAIRRAHPRATSDRRVIGKEKRTVFRGVRVVVRIAPDAQQRAPQSKRSLDV